MNLEQMKSDKEKLQTDINNMIQEFSDKYRVNVELYVQSYEVETYAYGIDKYYYQSSLTVKI